MPKLNDGNGLMDTEGMFDSLIADLNTSLRYLFEGQCIAYCDAIQKIAVKIAALKTGVLNELAAKDATIDRLKADQKGT